MTPEEMYVALNARKKALRWPWWKVALKLGCDTSTIYQMRRGRLSRPVRERAEEWLAEPGPEVVHGQDERR